MTDQRQVLIILNPTAGRGRAAARIQPLLQELDAVHIPYDLVRTGSPGQAVVLAQESRSEGYRAVIAAGGDGTINEIINGLAVSLPDDQPVGPLAVLSNWLG